MAALRPPEQPARVCGDPPALTGRVNWLREDPFSLSPSIYTLKTSVVDPNTWNLDPDPGFWYNLDPDPDPGLYDQF